MARLSDRFVVQLIDETNVAVLVDDYTKEETRIRLDFDTISQRIDQLGQTPPIICGKELSRDVATRLTFFLGYFWYAAASEDVRHLHDLQLHTAYSSMFDQTVRGSGGN